MGVVRYNGIGMVTEDEFNTGLAGKLDKPEAAGNAGEVLTKTSDGEEWAPISSTGVPADSAMSDSSTNSIQNKVVKAYVDDNFAKKDGYYEQLVSGSAKNLEAPITVSDTFLTRPTGGTDTEAADGVAQMLEAEGNSVKFNQLAKALKNADYTPSNVTVSYSNGVATVTSSTDTSAAKKLTLDNFVPTSGHKYYLAATIDATHSSTAAFVAMRLSNNAIEVLSAIAAGSKGRTSNIGTASSSIMFCLSMGNATPSGEYAIFEDVLCIDLTAMGIDNLTTVEQVEAWLAENIGAMAYYPYTTGTVLNNCMEGIEAPGYNLLDPTTGKAQIIGAYSDLYGNYYGIVGTHGALTFTDAYGNESTITPDSDGKFELTVPGELSVASAGADCAVFLWWDGTKKEYEDYELNHGYLDVKHIYGKLNGEGDLVQVYAAGMARVGDNKDYLHNVDGSAVADKVIGSRAYTSGDESDSTVITDGTTTYYHLTTELRYTNLVYQGSSHYADGTPVVLPVNYEVNNWSIESILPKNTSSALVTAPAALTCKYSLGAVDLLNTHTDEIAELYDKKADKDGTYPELISGNLIDGNGVGTDQEIMFRPTGGGAALAGNSNAIIQTIKGRTLVWNQLVDDDTETVTVQSGHKYFALIGGVASVETSDGTALSVTGGTDNVIDLTVLFNGNVPANFTIKDFRDLFPESYYAYNAGTLLPFKGTGLKTVGFNRFDESTLIVGKYRNTNNVESDNATRRRSDVYFQCFPSAKYYLLGDTRYTSSYAIVVCFYDANKDFIYGINTIGGVEITTPANAAFFRVSSSELIGKICINYSDANRNGQYEPYEERTLSLPIIGKTAKDGDGNAIVPFPEGMNDLNTTFDECDKVGGTKSIKRIALDSLSWIYNSTYAYFYANVPTGIKNSVTEQVVVADKYSYGGVNNYIAGMSSVANLTIWQRDNSGTLGAIFIKDTGYTDATTFTAALEGLYMDFILSTPVPFTWDTPLGLIYPAPAGGTEMLLPEGVDESGVPATTPMDATIFYSKDYVQTINDMPKDFDTTASIDALTTALANTLGPKMGGTLTITRGAYDEANKKYAWAVTFVEDAQ